MAVRADVSFGGSSAASNSASINVMVTDKPQ